MEEPIAALRWAMLHFAGGDAFLIGLLLFAVGQILLLRRSSVPTESMMHGSGEAFRPSRFRRWLGFATCGGLIWALIDPPPVPWPLIAIFAILLLGSLVNWWRGQPPATSAGGERATLRTVVLRTSLASCALIVLLNEARHCFFHGPAETVRRLSVVGDSVTAGLNDGEDTWPKRLSRRVDVTVLDASQPGATLKSALRQVELLNDFEADLLILEIGGNDLLEGLPVEEFERHLDQLLAASQKPGRSTVLFELPLPPLSVRYCDVQRRLAARYQVALVPRRQFLQVMTTAGGTVDGIHLSDNGQARLTDLVEGLLTFLPGQTGTYRHVD